MKIICFRIKKIVVNKKVIEDEVLVGISDNNFGLEGVDLLLHEKIIKGEIYCYEKPNDVLQESLVLGAGPSPAGEPLRFAATRRRSP